MRKKLSLLLSVLMLTALLSACGGQAAATADMEQFWTELSGQRDMPDMMELNDEMRESLYPGLGDIAAKQLVIKVPAMSAVVSEYVFMEAETEQGAKDAAAVLQARVDQQAAGGAWYPDSVEAWAKAKVVTSGRFVAMIAAGDDTDAIAQKWQALFA